MPRGVVTYIVVVVVASWLLGAGVWALQNALEGPAKGLAALLFLLLPFIFLLTALILHRREAAGNPYVGLVWGPTGWYWLLFLGGMAAGALIIGAQWALGLIHIDPAMSDYIAMNRDAAFKSSGKELPASMNGTFAIAGWFTFWSALTIGPWIGTALGCISSFPQFGWLGRRLLVRSRAFACIVLMLISGAIALAAAGINNPALGEMSLPAKIGLYALGAMAAIPASLWVFLRTRSAVLTALLGASFGAGMTAATPFLADYAPWLSGPQGIASSAGLLLIGIALWVWQDPGGQDLAVAAVAQDGTPLTPEMLKQAQAYSAQQAATPIQPEG